MIKVYGDIMLDRWIVRKPHVSSQKPVIALKEIEQQFCSGGAGNPAVNIANLNGEIGVYGSIVSDKEGYPVIEQVPTLKK